MKRFLFFILCASVAYISNAQLKVDASGRVSIARDTSSVSRAKMTIGNGTPTSLYEIGLYSSMPVGKGDISICVDGTAYSDSVSDNRYYGYERAIGVRGLAGNSSDGSNIGVLGVLRGDRMGAGIYGSINSLRGNILDGYYAGYFDGETKIDGDLTVTGYVTGLLLSESGDDFGIAPASISEISTNNNVVSSLSGLSAISYYKNQQTSVQSDATETMSISDSIGLVNTIETQNRSKRHFGLSAEMLENTYPELVYEMPDGTKRINYIEIIPLLVQSINELSSQIEALTVNSSNAKLARSVNETSSVETFETEKSTLSQNSPNPFVTTTNINIYIPSAAKKATLNIYDMTGKLIKEIPVTQRGNETVTLTNSGLSAGMYLYSLSVDGNIINTKRMILTN